MGEVYEAIVDGAKSIWSFIDGWWARQKIQKLRSLQSTPKEVTIKKTRFERWLLLKSNARLFWRTGEETGRTKPTQSNLNLLYPTSQELQVPCCCWTHKTVTQNQSTQPISCSFFCSSHPHISMENPTPSPSDSLTSTLCNSIQALGRGFDVTSDFRLLYCKGAPGSRLVYLDEEHATDLVLSRTLVLPNVSSDICCSPGQSSMEKIPVCSFHEVICFCTFSCLLDFDGV